MMLLGMIAVLASCRDKEPDMTLVQGTWYQEYLINEVQADDVWNLTIVQDDGPSYVELEYSAFLEEYIRIEHTDAGFFHFYLTRHSHFPYNTVLKATIHTNKLTGLTLNKEASAVLVGDFSGPSLKVEMYGTSTCKGGSFMGGVNLVLHDGSQLVDFSFDGSSCDVLLDGGSVFKGTLTVSDAVSIELLDEARMTTYEGSIRDVSAVVKNNGSLNMLETAVDQIHIDMSASEAFVNVTQVLGGSLRDSSTLYYQPHPGLVFNLAVDETSHISPLNAKF